ncbi:hypothetical protein SLS62_008722 [Diatrype stigma]|uniref:BRCT domain-containing protein n=1 Tax=Diatrype stigma TaxID=117547 RepID=A0AAN9YMZ8_9PEZI
MDVATPPKRMTRARAAAKDSSSAPAVARKPTKAAPTKAAPAAAKAKTTSTTTASTATTTTAASTTAAAASSAPRTTATKKRKTRDDDDEENEQSAMKKLPTRTRGRPKRVATEPTSEPESEPELPQPEESSTSTATRARATRGRPKKAVTEPVKADPPKTTRTRVRKTAVEDKSAPAPSEPAKRTVRKRAAPSAKEAQGPGSITTSFSTEPTPGLKSAVSRPASRLNGGIIKKTVTFQEPEKENRLPPAATKSKEKAGETETGMRAKPVRKPAAGGRATRASTRSTSNTTEEKKEKSPLSPKKDGQNISLSRDVDSDDELATLEKTPLKPLMKSPIKAPISPKKSEPQPQPASDETDGAVQQAPEPTTSAVCGSPVRRIPPSPWKDALKSPAKRVEAIPSLLFSATKPTDSQSLHSSSKASVLQSPAKRPQMPMMLLPPPPGADHSEAPRSPLKNSLLQSPAKRPASPTKMMGSSVQFAEDHQPRLLFGAKSSPVKEEKEPVEVVSDDASAEAPVEALTEEPTEAPTEAPSEASTEAPTEAADETPIEAPVEGPAETKETESESIVDQAHASVFGEEGHEFKFESPAQLSFPGRLSAVLPRHADPALKEKSRPVEDVAEGQELSNATSESTEVQDGVSNKPEELGNDPMDVDELEDANFHIPSPTKSIGPQSPSKSPSKSVSRSAWGLRANDANDQDMSESEDELASSGKMASKYQDDATLNLSAVPATPTPAGSKTPRNGLPSSAVKAATRAIRSISRGPKLGFSPMAAQLSEWKASSSPLKRSNNSQPSGHDQSSNEHSLLEDNASPAAERSPSKSSFFDDEMKIRAEMEMEMEAALEADIAAAYDDEDPEFDDVPVTNDDVQLAAEANEMSLMDHAGIDVNAPDDSISDASQEYGDENAMPIDPALLNSTVGARNSNATPVTPVRPSTNRNLHTVSKVPLKPADDSPSRSIKKRSASATKLPPRRPSGLSRNATVISYSPTKDSSKMDIDQEDEATENPPVTPAKSDVLSTLGTPARTPRKDLNPALLRGAVVFVDVHTSEGAEANQVFIDLLTQMGARCVKSWPWNPSNDAKGESSSSKIGITHVVYKDGGKRTLEKVRESNGIVQCVGCSWVLDCERENQWLDEAPYYADTSLIPRGGRNRRKSMEPKALANFNGTLVTPMKANAPQPRECQTVPNNHVARRDSTEWQWQHSPSDQDNGEEVRWEQQHNWGDGDSMLTPVPKTPAPEAIAQYAMDLPPETPAPAEMDYEEDPLVDGDQLLARTCPPKQARYADLGEGLLNRDKDQSVLMRLMAARRKSLQFAPKIASPLSKAWK